MCEQGTSGLDNIFSPPYEDCRPVLWTGRFFLPDPDKYDAEATSAVQPFCADGIRWFFSPRNEPVASLLSTHRPVSTLIRRILCLLGDLGLELSQALIADPHSHRTHIDDAIRFIDDFDSENRLDQVFEGHQTTQ